ncbi:hypothetical protein D6T64_12105 [Cryobacterium melibiosiphilum]|uniref:Head-tail adaptor protein n=1 Tax=Cryobacterium melibiosiphilum TaxID=995039 RepID=A0A3A5MS14_9MICO|nr:hypothetical protein [Cryobacterium melibiosiphilum]RJT88124.1 hypothetical protein D6T64_12105 [Cryobacterium melibiosiphilum]
MDFPFGQTVTRERRKLIDNPYDPTSPTQGSWDDPDTITVYDAFVASSSSAAVPSATRTQVVTQKSLYCPPATDIVDGDRVKSGSHTYTVDAVPEADVSPFTGWAPPMEVPLVEVSG